MRSSTSGARRGATSRRGRSTARRIFPATMARPEVAPSSSGGGCRGFVGPVPPPLWMRRRMKLWYSSLPWHATWLQHRRGIIPLGAGTGEPMTDMDTWEWFGNRTFHHSQFEPPAKLRAAKERLGLTVSVCLPTRTRPRPSAASSATSAATWSSGPAWSTRSWSWTPAPATTPPPSPWPRGPGVPRARRPARRGPGVGQGRGPLEEPARLRGRPALLGRRRHPQLPRPLRLRAARPAARRPRDPVREGVLRAAHPRAQRPAGHRRRPGHRAAGPPLINLLWPELAGIVQPLSGEYAGRREPSSRCRSSPATGSSWACWSTSPPASGSTPSPRSTWTGGSTATRTCRRSAG